MKPRKKRGWAPVLVVLAAAGGGLWLWSARVGPVAVPPAGAAAARTEAAVTEEASAAPARGAPRAAEPPGHDHPGEAHPGHGDPARTALLAALAAALYGATPGAPAKAPGSLDKDYIQSCIQEIRPLLKECYDLALHEHPDLEGTLKVRFTIIGDPELGGLVEQSDILEGSAAGDAILTECVRETMYALQFEAPEGGGRVTVIYPFVFAPKE